MKRTLFIKRALQTALQLLMLILFIALIALGKIQLWMGFFVGGVIASFVFSRLYCGWICPINTVLRWTTVAKKKLKIKDRPIPSWLKNPWVRTIILILFVAVAVISQKNHLTLPIMPILFFAGIILTFFYPELLWHRYLCPYGAILRFPAKTAIAGMKINESACVQCGACARACPTKTISRADAQTAIKPYRINTGECLVCGTCQTVCKSNAITYTKRK
ncbi:MAG: 4Fe-4S binding protein [Eubacteriales bacterium]|nr:4Fe-4S binding protein [Eubacteriales bacterium]